MASNACVSCRLVFEADQEIVTCAECGCVFHVGKRCGVSERSFKAMKEATKKALKCAQCKLAAKSDDTPTKSAGLEATLEEINAKLSKMDVLETKLDALMTLHATVEKIEKSVQFLSDKYDDFNKTIVKQDKEIGDLRRRLEVVEKSHTPSTISKLQQEINELDQYSRRQNMEIHGLIPHVGENLLVELNKIASQLELPELRENDLEGLHRLPIKENKDPVIIVRFSTRKLKASWFEKRQMLRQKLPELKFFDNLTTTNRHLLWLAKGTAKEKNYMFAWASQGTVLVKKQPNGRIIKIRCEDDLNKIV